MTIFLRSIWTTRGRCAGLEDSCRHVTALERSLAVKLLNRSTRKLSLTQAGVVFYDHCANIVQEAELAEQRVTRTQAEPDALQQGKLVPLLRHFRPVPESGIYLVYFPNRSPPSRVRALIDFLVARFGPVAPWEMGW